MGSYLGKIVALYYCPAMFEGNEEEVLISGLFVVEEYMPLEPSNYVWSPYFVVYPADADTEDETLKSYDVDEAVFFEQVDPQYHGRQLVQEREWEFAEEQRDMDDRFGNNRTIHDAGFRQ